MNYGSEGYSNYWGLRLPTKYLCWFELVLISMISPHSSFLGHLCGICVGFMYVFGIFNPIFKLTDQLGIDQALERFQQQYNYDENAPAPQPQRRGMGGMGRMGMMGMGMGGFRRDIFKHYVIEASLHMSQIKLNNCLKNDLQYCSVGLKSQKLLQLACHKNQLAADF